MQNDVVLEEEEEEDKKNNHFFAIKKSLEHTLELSHTHNHCCWKSLDSVFFNSFKNILRTSRKFIFKFCQFKVVN